MRCSALEAARTCGALRMLYSGGRRYVHMRESGTSYSGDSSYRIVDALIRNGDRELLIVSPYISNYYSRMMLGMPRWKRVRIITSDSSMRYRDSLLRGMRRPFNPGRYYRFFAYVVLMQAVALYMRFVGVAVAIFLFMGAAAAALLFWHRRNPNGNIEVRVIDRKFVHEKLYIAESEAVVGSANLTYRGMHKNIEHVEAIDDPARVAELRRHFESLWNGY